MFLIIKHLKPVFSFDYLERVVITDKEKYSGSANIQAIIMIGLEDRMGRVIEKHALIRVCKNTDKTRLKRVLSSRILRDLEMPVDDYAIRHWSNDRRQNRQNIFKNCRRSNERRRKGFDLVKLCEKTYS